MEVDPATHAELKQLAVAGEGVNLTIDLPSQRIHMPDGRSADFPIDTFSRKCLIEGIDQLGYLLEQENAIASYEEKHRATGN